MYATSAGWIAVVWYSAYVNQRTQPGGGPKLVVGGQVVNPPDRQNRNPGYLGGNSSNDTNVSPQTTGVAGGRNPFPNATGGRLDQGYDLTGSSFNAPDASYIVFASSTVPGWKGGGLVAGRLLSGPKKGQVWYYAEGIYPTVSIGQTVRQGDNVGRAVANPYNGIMGNIEAGWANPQNPTQPLAQVMQNKPQAAWDFYNYIRSLGGPKASSTGNAGYP